MDAQKTALVTGGNKGLGLEICRQLAQNGYMVLLGSRDKGRGEEAAATLAQQGLDVRFIHIDMEDAASFDAAGAYIRQSLQGRLDVLVNNAGIALDWGYKADSVPMDMLRRTFETNFFALIDLTQRLLPFILRSPAGRIVNQSSVLGSLSLHNDPESGFEQLKAFAYNSSKTALNAFTIHLAQALSATPVKVNSAHPGDVRTDANKHGHIEVEEGAKTAVTLAMLPADGPSGGYFFHGDAIPW
ncbi:MAG: SDR family oxidoreductase [bacterium]|nr:SDR family oxidoreductase [bacterium]